MGDLSVSWSLNLKHNSSIEYKTVVLRLLLICISYGIARVNAFVVPSMTKLIVQGALQPEGPCMRFLEYGSYRKPGADSIPMA